MRGVEIAESKGQRERGKNHKTPTRDPVEWEPGAGPPARAAAQQQRYGPAASRGEAYHRGPRPRTAATAHSLLLAAWAALWISTCDRGPMRGPAARPGIVARPGSRSLAQLSSPPGPLPALPASRGVPHAHPPPFSSGRSLPPQRVTFSWRPSRSCPVLCHRPPPFPAAKKLCYHCTGRQHQRCLLVASPHSVSVLFFSSLSSSLWRHRRPHSWPLRTTHACGAETLPTICCEPWFFPSCNPHVFPSSLRVRYLRMGTWKPCPPLLCGRPGVGARGHFPKVGRFPDWDMAMRARQG